MTFSRHGSIVFGPGGRLADVPENHELLSRLREAPELTSEELLRLAEFYKAYPTNVALGNHLAQIALTKLERHRGAQGYRALQKIVFREYFEVVDAIEESAEAIDNTLLSGDDVTGNEHHEDFDDLRLFVRHLTAEGLLVETISGKNAGKDMNYNFIIGFSPAPADLHHE